MITDSIEGIDLYLEVREDCRLKVRVVTEQSWHSLFTGNMFIPPAPEALSDFEPDFTVIQAPNFQSIPEIDGTGSEVAVGRGDVPWDELMALLSEGTFRGWMTVSRSSGDNRVDDMARAIRFLNNVAAGP